MIPINCPYKTRVATYNRDGPMMVQNPGSGPNYEPNTYGGPVQSPEHAWHKHEVSGKVGRYAHDHPNDDYEQARTLYRKIFSETDRKHTTENIAGPLSKCRKDIQEKMLRQFV
jgi:catalase